ncbi:MAG: DUF484 family protein [Gammaproteobacteria bacterium]|nr:DUF484 family protein [Gammaproteobacteria bacterium]
MNSEQSPNKNAIEIDDRHVLDYLRHHPDFFRRHMDLLAELDLPHDSGAAVSLIERQVQILRQQRQELKERLDQLMEMARENEALSEDMHQFMLVLMDAETLDDVFGIADDYLRSEFDADAIGIRLVNGSLINNLHSDEVTVLDDNILPAFEKMLMAGNPSCSDLSREHLYYLFGERAIDIASNVVIPLRDDEMIYGILAIGSTDPERYNATMGTIFLRRFGEFLTRILKQFLGPEMK